MFLKVKMKIGSKIILKSFNGEKITPKDCDPSENYWLLIGKTGKVVKTINSNSRLLIKFDISVLDLGLHCHNEIPNSLYILESDLGVI